MTRYTPATFRSMGISATEQAEWSAIGCTNLEIITNLRLMGLTPSLICDRTSPAVRANLIKEIQRQSWGMVNAEYFEDTVARIRREDGDRKAVSPSEHGNALLAAIYGADGEQGGDEVEVLDAQEEDRYYSEAKYALPAASC